MSDFLHNLRTGNMDKQHYMRNRRPINTNNNNTNYNDSLERRAGNERRDSYKKKKYQSDSIYPLLEKIVAVLKISLEDITDNQKALMEISEQRVETEIRKAKALEAIVELIDYKFSEKTTNDTTQNMQEEELAATDAATDATTDATVEKEEIQAENDKSDAEIITPQHHFDFESKKINRNKIIAIITKMRESDATYGEIASYLEDHDMSTFSGRGRWHAQTVHRICQNHL